MKPSERIRELLNNNREWPDRNQGEIEAMEARLEQRIEAIIEYLDEQEKK